MVAERAVLADMGLLADPFARDMRSSSTKAIFWVMEHGPFRLRAHADSLAGMAARVLWFDVQVTEALDSGIEQIAVIGAGYDSRAWRFRRDGVRFFELDHGATQQDKMRRAPAPGPTYVEADLTHQSADEALREHGLDFSQPALFVLEGLTMYLDEQVVRQQLAELAKSTAVGSRLAVNFHPAPDAGTSRDRRLQRVQRLGRTGSGEPFRLLIDRPRAVDLVEASGWVVNEEVSLREAAQALIRPGSGLPIEAINEHKSLVAGVRS